MSIGYSYRTLISIQLQRNTKPNFKK